MYSKTEVREKPYSKEQVKELKKLFKELVKFKDSPSVKKYTAKRLAELKG
ncbi:MAG TPA: hypothetical protein VFF13_00010 [archaeon]|nr:hypothetical protein [archaeon]